MKAATASATSDNSQASPTPSTVAATEVARLASSTPSGLGP